MKFISFYCLYNNCTNDIILKLIYVVEKSECIRSEFNYSMLWRLRRSCIGWRNKNKHRNIYIEILRYVWGFKVLFQLTVFLPGHLLYVLPSWEYAHLSGCRLKARPLDPLDPFAIEPLRSNSDFVTGFFFSSHHYWLG